MRPTSNPALELFGRLAEPFTGEALFDRLDDVVFFAKNDRAEYVLVNRALVERCGAASKSALIGRTAEAVFPAPMGRSYLRQDEALIRSGAAIVNQLELHLYPGGRTGWCLTNKVPLLGRTGRIVGLVGSSQDLRPPAEDDGDHDEVARSVQFARENLESRPAVGDLARVAGLSAYQIDRRIRRLFRLSAGQLLLKLRIDAAAERLRGSSEPIASIAIACGYSDQSAFARQFRRTIGLTPLEYRSIYRTC